MELRWESCGGRSGKWKKIIRTLQNRWKRKDKGRRNERDSERERKEWRTYG